MFKQIIETVKAKLGLESKQVGEDIEDAQTHEDEGVRVDNNNIRANQVKILAAVLIGIIIGMGVLIKLVQKKVAVKEELKKSEELKIDLPDKVVDGEKMWRNHYEDELKRTSDELKERLTKAENLSRQTKDELLEEIKKEISDLKEQLQFARAELAGASGSLAEVAAREQERINSVPPHEEPNLDIEDFAEEVERDMPKSAKDYVPEGTYFTGYLMGGIVVSTALNTPDENATPLTIRLKGRGNLASQNDTDISKCRIMGSAYGDLSSERAVIRLEKLICEKNGMYETSSIVGDVHGPDGFNGIKGEVVATSSKHIKNAMIGGVLSGLGNSVKGQEAINITTDGMISTPKKGFKDMAREGVLTGVSNAGEKIADYYLRQAERLSPVLTIPGGVRVNAHITKGFFMGEIGTHKRIAGERVRMAPKEREGVKNPRVKNKTSNSSQEDGSDDGWK